MSLFEIIVILLVSLDYLSFMLWTTLTFISPILVMNGIKVSNVIVAILIFLFINLLIPSTDLINLINGGASLW